VNGYTQETTGFSVTAGRHVGRWSRAFLNYAYEIIKITEVDASEINNNNPFYPGFGGGYSYGQNYNPLLFGDLGKRKESRITPNILYNTVNNPWTPSQGMRHTATLQIAGGPLGGTVSYFRPTFESIVYIPQSRKISLGLRGQVAWILPYGDTQVLPLYQRYFLGGEQQVRGYPIRSIGPTDSTGRSLGGNKFLLGNAEYYYDVFGPLRMLLFFDAGQAFLEGERMNVKDMRISYGVEARFVMPVLNVPFRLIYAINPNRTGIEKLYIPERTFKFAVGTTF
jgi:outer membrane protein insertion porin family